MPIKLANNAVAQLAAPLEADGTTIVLVAQQVANFPILAAGDFFPLTLSDAAGHYEIVRVTAIAANILTAVRGQEGTDTRAFLAGDRAEIRLTAGAIAQIQSDAKLHADTITEALHDEIDADLAAGLAAERSTSAAERSASANEIASTNNALSSLQATVGTKFDKAGGVISGAVTLTSDLTTYRPASPGTGVVFLGNSGARYLFYDGTNYTMPGAGLHVNGSPVWTSGNFDPGAYLPLGGGTMYGNFTIQNTSPQITFYDSDWGPRYLHCNSGQIGFLTSGGGWACYSDNAGNFIATANIGAYSDRKHKTDIEAIEGALELVGQMRGVRYTRIRDGAKCVGVIAQEMQEVVPEVVGESQDGLYVDYGNLAAILIPAIQELTARLKKLEGG